MYSGNTYFYNRKKYVFDVKFKHRFLSEIHLAPGGDKTIERKFAYKNPEQGL